MWVSSTIACSRGRWRGKVVERRVRGGGWGGPGAADGGPSQAVRAELSLGHPQSSDCQWRVAKACQPFPGLILHSHLPARHVPSNRESPQQQTCPRCHLGHSSSFPSAVGAVLWQQGKGCRWDFLRMVVSLTGDYSQLLSWCILNWHPSPLPGKLYFFKHLVCRWGNIAHALLWRQLNSASRASGKSLNYCHLTGGLFSILLFTGHPYNLKMDNAPARAHLAKELFLFSSALALAQAGTAAKPGSSCHPKFKIDLPSGSIYTSFS